MPPLYLMDDYERCMDEDPSQRNVYCYARSQIKPNASSPIWTLIEVIIEIALRNQIQETFPKK